MNVYCSSIHKYLKLETAQMFFYTKMVKQTIAHAYNGILPNNKEEDIDKCNKLDESQRSQSQKVTYYMSPFL